MGSDYLCFNFNDGFSLFTYTGNYDWQQDKMNTIYRIYMGSHIMHISTTNFQYNANQIAITSTDYAVMNIYKVRKNLRLQWLMLIPWRRTNGRYLASPNAFSWLKKYCIVNQKFSKVYSNSQQANAGSGRKPLLGGAFQKCAWALKSKSSYSFNVV